MCVCVCGQQLLWRMRPGAPENFENILAWQLYSHVIIFFHSLLYKFESPLSSSTHTPWRGQRNWGSKAGQWEGDRVASPYEKSPVCALRQRKWPQTVEGKIVRIWNMELLKAHARLKALLKVLSKFDSFACALLLTMFDIMV